MHFQFLVAPPSTGIPAPPPIPQPVDPAPELLRELLNVQREQLGYAKASFDHQISNSRWRHFLNRWNEEYPQIGSACEQSVPTIERAFLELLDEITRRINDTDDPPLADEYAMSEFLDRYGMKLSQLGTMLNILGPLADASRTRNAGDS